MFKVVPYHIAQNVSDAIKEIIFTSGESIYEVDEPEIDGLYFVLQGKVKMEARFAVDEKLKFPVKHN
jgi:hypothetical protein